jgi:hypothetical protein
MVQVSLKTATMLKSTAHFLIDKLTQSIHHNTWLSLKVSEASLH